jgi:hypothetical protein
MVARMMCCCVRRQACAMLLQLPCRHISTLVFSHTALGLCTHYVEELAQLVQLGARPDQALREVARVAGGKAHALDARHIVHMPQQVCESPGPTP